MADKPPSPELTTALHQLEVQALNFAYRFLKDDRVRLEYIRHTQEMSRNLQAMVASGEMTAANAAGVASQQRNQIMEAARLRSSDLGRAKAVAIKAKGMGLDGLLEKYAQKAHKAAFGSLTPAQQTDIYLEVVKAAGRPNPAVNARAAKVGAAGRALFLVSLGLAAYNIGAAENKGWQAGREGANLGGGFAGGAAGGALAGIWFGPLGVAIGAGVGGVLGSLMADEAYMQVVGPADEYVKRFLAKYDGFWSFDADGVAAALADECGINMDQAYAVYREVYENHWSKRDNVAVRYVQLVRSRGGPILAALKLHAPLRALLSEAMAGGWTTAEERQAIDFLKGL